MDYYSIIASNFQDTIESIAHSVDDLAGPIERGSELLVQALLEDHKIVCCGAGADAALAQLFANNLLACFEHERPALPALALGADGGSVTAIARSSGINDIYSRQIKALGQPGDVLLIINSASTNVALHRATQAARERNMGLVALSNRGDHELGTLIGSEDVEISVEANRQARIIELQAMILNCLCELIEHRLFGSYNQE